MSAPFELRLAGGTTVPLSTELVAELEAALRAWRRMNTPRRDLTAEIKSYLAVHASASTTEIARGIRARDCDVRDALNDNPGFVAGSNPGRGRGRARRWELAERAQEPVPSAGTGTFVLAREIP